MPDQPLIGVTLTQRPPVHTGQQGKVLQDCLACGIHRRNDAGKGAKHPRRFFILNYSKQCSHVPNILFTKTFFYPKLF